jgi:hypothetical protein
MTGFAKLFASIAESSINEAELHVRWFFAIMLAKADSKGLCYGTPAALARIANVPLDKAQDALHQLEMPDPTSTSPDQEGRRVIPLGGNLWQIVNYLRYRDTRSDDERREYKRLWQKEKRAKGRVGVDNLSSEDFGGPKQKQKQKQKQKEKEKRRDRTRFTPPTLEETRSYIQEKGYHFTAEEFIGKGEAVGWVTGKNQTPLKSWRGWMATWEANWRENHPERATNWRGLCTRCGKEPRRPDSEMGDECWKQLGLGGGGDERI